MNLPNKLTVLRVLLIPIFLVFIYLESIPFHYTWATLTFIIASLTDWFDGRIARSRNLVTTFGKFLDPLADKILVIAALTVFVELDDVQMSAIPLIIITTREFIVSGLRLMALESGVVIAAGFWGKLKTFFTMVTIIAILVYLVTIYDFTQLSEMIPANVAAWIDNWILEALIWISTVLTIISGAVYLKNGWKYISKSI